MHGQLWQECCATGGGGGDQATDQAPEVCRPNATQSLVPSGPRAHTLETASLGRVWRTVPKWSRRSSSPPSSMPLGGSSNV